MLLSLGCYILSAQNIEQQLKDLFAPLDKSQVQSGILLQQAPAFVHPAIYDGIHTNDSSAANIHNWSLLYAQLRNASTGNPFLPNPNVYLNTCLKQLGTNQAIPIMLMVAQYDYIK